MSKWTLINLAATLLMACGSQEDGSGATGSGGSSATGGAGGISSGGGGAAGTGASAGSAGSGAGSGTGGSAGSTGTGGAPSAPGIGPQPVPATPLAQGTLFAAPNGNGADCSQTSPCDIWTAVEKASGGDVVFLRGGTYPIEKNLSFSNQSTAASPVVYESYPGELAVLDGSQHTTGTKIYVRVTGKFVQLRRLEVKNMPMQGIWIGGTDNLLDGVHSHHNGLSGIQIYSPYTDFPYGAQGSRNVLRNSTANDNSGAGIFDAEFANGGNSDGISISSGADNRVENCLVYQNSDDGIDTWRSTGSYVGYSVSHSNGIADGNGQGIKAGGQPPSATTVVERCLSHSNKSAGFDFNSGKSVKFVNNTSWNNNGGYSLGADTTATANIAGESKTTWGAGLETNNSWQRSGSVSFVSTDPSSADFLVPVKGGGFDDIGAHAPKN